MYVKYISLKFQQMESIIMNEFIDNIKSIISLPIVSLILLVVCIFWIYLIIKGKGSKIQAIICAILTTISVFLGIFPLISKKVTEIESIIPIETVHNITEMYMNNTTSEITTVTTTNTSIDLSTTTIPKENSYITEIKTPVVTDTISSTTLKWHETELSEILYIKESCYSRIEAIVSSDTVKKYEVGTKINVIAATDTGYYKLTDGTFIHSDYVTDKAYTQEIISIDESDIFIYSNVHKLTLNVGESKCITITSTIHEGLTVGTTDKSVSTATWVKPIVWDGDDIQIRIIAKGC